MAKIHDFLCLMEGELLANKRGTLRVEMDPYNLYRLLLRLPQPDNYIQPNGNAMVGLLTHLDPISYEDTKSKLDRFGIKYTEDDGGTSDLWDKENKHEDSFPVSPYPNNSAVPSQMKKWKGSKPTATKPVINRSKNKKII
jgi:hypothetical protein